MNDGTDNDDLAQLRRHACVILEAGADGPTFVPATEALRQLVERCSGFDFDDPANAAERLSKLPEGVALAPVAAARCAAQPWRTAAFVQGAAVALTEALQRCGDRPVRVLYAGCGPFALLALPLMALWPASQARFTLLDIHRQSLASARRLIGHLGLEESVAAWVEADATTYAIDAAAPPDVILSETMSAALAHEPQVAIARHLLAQAPQALMVPACVRIDLALCDPARENGYEAAPRHDRIALGEVFRLDAGAIERWAGQPPGFLPAATLTLPRDIAQRYQPRLLTHIEVFDGIALSDYACSLNLPRPLPRPLGDEVPLRGGEALQFTYRQGGDPGLEYRIISPSTI